MCTRARQILRNNHNTAEPYRLYDDHANILNISSLRLQRQDTSPAQVLKAAGTQVGLRVRRCRMHGVKEDGCGAGCRASCWLRMMNQRILRISVVILATKGGASNYSLRVVSKEGLAHMPRETIDHLDSGLQSLVMRPSRLHAHVQ